MTAEECWGHISRIENFKYFDFWFPRNYHWHMFASKKHWFSRISSNCNSMNFFHTLGNEPEVYLGLRICKKCNTSTTKHSRINLFYFCKTRVQLKTSQLLLCNLVYANTHIRFVRYMYTDSKTWFWTCIFSTCFMEVINIRLK